MQPNTAVTHLFLDLDQTCIHSVDRAEGERYRHRTDRHDGYFTVGDEFMTFVRPGLVDFLRGLDPARFRLHVWTAGTRDYAVEIAGKLFAARGLRIEHVYHRDHCNWSLATHGQAKRLRTVRESAHSPASPPRSGRFVLLDDLPEMAFGQASAAVTVPQYFVQDGADVDFFANPARVLRLIGEREGA
jgi:hypothetical protein